MSSRSEIMKFSKGEAGDVEMKIGNEDKTGSNENNMTVRVLREKKNY